METTMRNYNSANQIIQNWINSQKHTTNQEMNHEETENQEQANNKQGDWNQ